MEKNTQFVGQSLAFLDAVEQAGRAAELNRPVLVIGERGTGKGEVLEHWSSPDWRCPAAGCPVDGMLLGDSR